MKPLLRAGAHGAMPIVATLLFSGCTPTRPDPPQDQQSTILPSTESMVESGDVTHCRLSHNPNVGWKIRPVSAEGMANQSNWTYHIILNGCESGKDCSNAWVTIEEKDRITLSTEGDGRLRLEHRRAEGGDWDSGKSSLLAQGVLNRDAASGLWFKGEVFTPGRELLGDYYAFLLEDSEPCRAPTSDPDRACRQIHFEYYQQGDDSVESHRPRLSTEPDPNVFPLEDKKCTFAYQTDEGDGDEGPP